MRTVYISEPQAINLEVTREVLPAEEYELVAGSPSFDGDPAVLQACEVLMIRSGTHVTDAIRAVFPNLQHIVRVGVGVDNIDLAFCKQQGISVYNAPGANADAVSDYVVTMMFYALRNLHQLTQDDARTWNRFKFTGRSMAGRSIGIIGFGNIGKQIFTKLQGFECRAFYVYDPFIKAEDMPDGVTYAETVDTVLRQSDVVTLHVPLLPTTQYMINRSNLSLLPEGAILINASRGGIVNEADVVAQAAKRTLTYIADTVENEPHPSTALLEASHVIVTPHIASLTEESDENMVRVALRNFLDGRSLVLS